MGFGRMIGRGPSWANALPFPLLLGPSLVCHCLIGWSPSHFMFGDPIRDFSLVMPLYLLGSLKYIVVLISLHWNPLRQLVYHYMRAY